MRGYGMGPHWGLQGRRGDWGDQDEDGGGPGYGMGRGMGPQWGWHGRHGGWGDDEEDHAGPGYGMGRSMGPCDGGHMRGWHDNRGSYEPGPHHGICPRWGSRDRDETDGSRGGWKQQDWRGGGSAIPNEERLNEERL